MKRTPKKLSKQSLSKHKSGQVRTLAARKSNLRLSYDILSKYKKLEQAALEDESFQKLFNNTSIKDNQDNEVNDEDRARLKQTVAYTAVIETADAVAANEEPVDNSEEKIRGMVVIRARDIIKDLRADVKEVFHAVKEQRAAIKDRLRNAFNSDERVSIKGSRIVERFNNAKAKLLARWNKVKESATEWFSNRPRKYATIALSAMTFVASVVSCSRTQNQQAPQRDGFQVEVDTGTAKVDSISTLNLDRMFTAKDTVIQEKVVAPDTIKVPTEYSKDMKLPRGAWSFDNVKKYYGERFEQAYRFLAQNDSLLNNGQDSLTVMQALNQVRGHNEMNTDGAKKVVEALTACEGDEYKLTKDDVKFIFTPIPKGNRDVVATGLTYEDCTPKQHHQKITREVKEEVQSVDTVSIKSGQNELRINETSVTENVPSKAVSAQEVKSNQRGAQNTDVKVLNDSVDVNDIINDVNVSAQRRIKVETGNVASTDSVQVNENASADSVRTTSQSTHLEYTSARSNIVIENDSVSIQTSQKDIEASASDEQEYEIIIGAENAEEGAPSAGYVDERGGFENTGLSKDVLKTDSLYFEDVYGKGAYDTYRTNLSNRPELFVNGAVFGGWVPEQALHAWGTVERWSDNKVENKLADPKMVTTNITMENFMDNKCGKDSLTDEEQALMAPIFNRVTTTGRIIGIEGDKAVRNTKLRATDDCQDPSIRTIEKTDTAVAGPWGKLMPRIFRNDLPIVIKENENQLLINETVERQEVPSQGSAQYEKSNMGPGISDTKVLKENIPVNEVIKKVNVNSKKRIKVYKGKHYGSLADLRKSRGRG